MNDTSVFTTQPVNENGSSRTEVRPEFIRLPKPGRQCPYTGLPRSGLNALILPSQANGFRPAVKSISLRRRGSQRGIRLISYDSLMNYLHGLAQDGETKGQSQATLRTEMDSVRADELAIRPSCRGLTSRR